MQIRSYLLPIVPVVTIATTIPVQAAVVSIDMSAYAGPNGGVQLGTSTTLSSFPIAGNSLILMNHSSGIYDLVGLGSIGLRLAAGETDSSLVKFTTGDSIGATSSYSNTATSTAFSWIGGSVSDFGPNSFVGFQASNGSGGFHYGYIEVTWTNATQTFQIISAAYETDVNTAIAAGAAIPAPGAIALLGLAGLAGRRRR